jgi:hypothetical protein
LLAATPERLLLAAVPALVALGTLSGCARHPAASATSPNGGAATGAPALPEVCHVSGDAQIVASNVWASRVFATVRPGGGYDVTAMDVEPCLNVTVGPYGKPLGGPTLGACPAVDKSGNATATNGTETYVARDEKWDNEPPHLVLGVFTWEWPHAYAGEVHEGQRRVVERVFFPPGGGAHTGETMPGLATFGHDRFLVVWVEGDDVRGQPLARWAEPVGEALDISPPEARVVAHPAAAFARDGTGIVVYLGRTRTGNHLLATPLYCQG